MVAITKLIMLGIAIVCLFTLALILLDFVTDKVKSASSKKRNKVHFYVARDKNGELWLYIGKPYRSDTTFRGDLNKGVTGLTHLNLRCFGLNKDDYTHLKWEDEPVEVFINMED